MSQFKDLVGTSTRLAPVVPAPSVCLVTDEEFDAQMARGCPILLV